MGISTTEELESPTETAKADHLLDLHTSSDSLPDEPLVTIEASRSWLPINFGDLWTYRELLYFLAWRDIKLRYKQTVLGITWVVMQPLLITLIFSVVLGILARVPTGGVPYALLVYSGLLPWNLFSSGLSSADWTPHFWHGKWPGVVRPKLEWVSDDIGED